ncbi:MAG: hypothetical protein RLZZ312_688 [Bacteroidota bacterium]|jgi:phosphoesterase RecJ-like protein
MNETDFAAIKKLLEIPQKIAIIPHRNPDGDAMGSSLGMYHFLQKMNHDVFVIIPNEYPDFLAWMPGAEHAIVFEKNVESTTKILANCSVVFALDFNALHRVGDMEKVLEVLQTTFIMIDHHQEPADFATYTFSDISYGSTCEMIYDFIVKIDGKQLIDKNIATCIYTGILTDSGGFRYPKTTSKTHKVVAELIDKGAENTKIPNLLFDNNSMSRLQLMSVALKNLKVFEDKKAAYMYLSQKELDDNNFVKGDTEGIVNYGLSIKGINFVAIFVENRQENIIKISFRSQGDFDVNKFARQYFEGGGHINAAGGRSTTSLSETILKFENLIEKL